MRDSLLGIQSADAHTADVPLTVPTAVSLTVLPLALFTRRRTRPVHKISVVILPLGPAPRREPEPEPVLFRDKEDY